jgi:proline iminopeptidase
MTTMSVRDVSLFVKVAGHGYPLLLMHGGPGLDHISLLPFRRLAGQFTLIFYDHRCNGRSNGVPVATMTWENLTADADALREKLGYDQWAVLGHSFGGHVALEYALRYPDSLSHLILMDTGGDTWWSQENAPELLARRGFSAETVDIARRWCHGQIEPHQMVPYARKLAGAYEPHLSPRHVPHALFMALRMKTRPEPFLFGFTELCKGWNVMDRLGEIDVPALVLAGRDDWMFPPEHQAMLAAGIPDARLAIIERAGHNPQDEQPAAVMDVVRNFLLTSQTPAAGPGVPSVAHQAIDAMIEGEMRRLRIPGAALAIVEGEEMVHVRGFGRARPGGEPPTPDTPFFIGSLTKAVTALAVMQLVEAGRVELDAPVQRYLPWFRVADAAASARMTVRQLLNQTSGLPTRTGEPGPGAFDDSPGAAERQARALATVELAHPPGAAFEYSNANYDLLGLVVEAASGESYAGYVQQHIFDPLGMNHTFTAPGLAAAQGLATGHRYWFGWPIPAPDLPVAHASLASGQLISTAADMARFLIAHLNGGRLGEVQILSSAGIDELQRGAAAVGASGLGPLERLLARDVPPYQYAMGWFIDQSDTSRLVWHSGTLPHFGAFMALTPEQKKGLVLLFNACHHWMNPVYAEFGGRVAALLAGEQPVPMPAVRAIPWMLRALPLVPVLQLAGAAATLRRIRRWNRDPERRPHGTGAWRRHLVLPLIANLQAAQLLRAVLGKRRHYLQFYLPDFALLAAVSGGFALLWGLVRTVLVGKTLSESRLPDDE